MTSCAWRTWKRRASASRRSSFCMLPEPLKGGLDEVVSISRTLRKERELAFYGTEDWIPTEEYGEDDSLEAIRKAEKVFALVSGSL